MEEVLVWYLACRYYVKKPKTLIDCTPSIQKFKSLAEIQVIGNLKNHKAPGVYGISAHKKVEELISTNLYN